MSGLGKARSRAAAQADEDTAGPKKRRGRPPKEGSGPNAMDVLFAKGAAAQAQTNPGNLLFYQLCEERYDAWAKLSDGDPRRRSTCEEIVESILSRGGVFRTKTGGVLPRKNAVEKARDRMRQIGKPKIRPQGFGEHDVVFARGAAIHVYPGNAKWRVLVEGRVASYWRDAVYGSNVREGWQTETVRRTKKGKFAKGNCNQKARPAYQREIVDELIEIIHSRGGKFRHEGGSEATSEQVHARVHQTLKDMKKDYLSGKRTFAPWVGAKKEEPGDDACARDPSVAMGNADVVDVQVKQEDGTGRDTNAGPEAFRNRSHGFTSVKTAVSSERELLAWQRKHRKKPNKRRVARRADKDVESDDEGSLQSDLYSDGDSDSSDESVDVDWEDMSPQRASKRQQDAAREERLQQRRSGVVKSPPPAKKRRRRRRSTTVQEEAPPPDDPAHPLSEYELYRLEKIRKNQEKLAELGLLNGKERKAARV
ncbi:hypothetical protein ACHAXT_012972 [Thalassiosira profunda]